MHALVLSLYSALAITAAAEGSQLLAGATDSADGARPVSIRTARPLTVALEVGYSGLAGLGANVAYSFTPHWALDGGLGVSVQGFKLGARGRYNLLAGPLTPFVGLGLMGTANAWGELRLVPFAQAVLGGMWTLDKGFTLLGTAGWMQRLDGKAGVAPTPFSWTGSDVVASLAVGYSF